MELAARPDVSALERVPTAAVGAAAVPASAVEGIQLQEQLPVMHDNAVTGGGGMGGVHGAGMEGGMRNGVGMGRSVEVGHRSSPVGVTTPVGGGRVGHAERKHRSKRGLLRSGRGSSSSSSSSSSSDEEGLVSNRRGVHTIGGVRSATAVTGTAAVGGEEVCGRKYFSEVEDRPVVKEQRTRYIEHHPVQKEFVTEVKYVGEQEVHTGKSVEQVDARVRTVAVTQPKSPCETIGCTDSDTCNMPTTTAPAAKVQGGGCPCGRAGCKGCSATAGGCSCGVAGCPGCGGQAGAGVTQAPAGELLGV
jgi:hypothetical protein